MIARRLPDPTELGRFLRTETVGGTVLLGATAIALIWANSPLAGSYLALRETVVGPAALHLDLTVAQWATDGLLALFFYVVGLELKRELVLGELSSAAQALLPVAAAAGGMVLPAGLALTIGWGSPGIDQAWAIPVATDIAFALAVLALTGSALPSSARVFLLGLAVVDDLGAIALIAVLFSTGLNLLALVGAALGCGAYWRLQRRRIRAWWCYLPLAVLVWALVHEAGVHATIAGVVLGLLTRVRPDPDEREAPALRLEHRLQPWSAGLCVPLFALFAAGVPIGVDALRAVGTEPVAIGVVVGLLAGKVIGIFGFSWLAIRLTSAARPSGLSWRDLLAVSMLGGVGFTVSLLIAELALADQGPLLDTAKAAVLLASAAASLIGAALLHRRGRAHAARGGSRPVVAQPCRTSNPDRASSRATVEGWPGRSEGIVEIRSTCRRTAVASSTSSSGADVPPVLPSIPLSPEPVKAPADQSIGSLVKEATGHMSTLIRAEVELAKAEVTAEVRKGVQGSIFFIIALTILLFSLFFLFFTLAELLALWLNRPASFAIVFGVMLLFAGLSALIGYARVRKIRKPERTISSLKESAHVLSQVGRGSDNGAAPRPELRGGPSSR